MKKKLLTSLFVAFSVCMGVSTACLTAGASDAEITVDNANVTMVAGASARISDDGYNGLRYTMTTSATDYQGLKATYGANVSFGILIAPKAYDDANELNAANVFGEEAVYDWAEWDEATETYVYSGNKTRIINLSSATMKAAENDENTYVLYGAIANLKAENITKEFVGVGYIAYGDGETTNYKFLADNDNTRSMAYVAQVYQTLDGVAQETKDLVKENYITGKADQEDTFYTVNHMFSDGNGGYTVGETEQVTAKINETTVAPTAKTFVGYTFDQTNANNATGGDIVYANGKTTANIYYVNNAMRLINKDGDTYTPATNALNYRSAFAYTNYGTYSDTVVYSVKVSAPEGVHRYYGQPPQLGITMMTETPFETPVSGMGGTHSTQAGDAPSIQLGITDVGIWSSAHGVSGGNARRIDTPEADRWNGTTVNPSIAIKGKAFDPSNGTTNTDSTVTERTFTTVLYKDVVYMYVDGAYVCKIAPTNGNYFQTAYFTAGLKYTFGVQMTNFNTATTKNTSVTVLDAKYGEEALAEINSNLLYKMSIITPMTANATKVADGSYKQTSGWFNYSYAYTSTKFSDTVVYKTQITTTNTDLGSCNPGGQWIARVGIVFSNGDTVGATTYKDRNGGTRNCQENWLSSGFVALGAYPTNSGDARKWIGVGSGIDGICSYLSSGSAEATQHTRYYALGSPVYTNVTLTAVLYKGTVYVYVNDAYKTSISLDSDLFDWTNVNGVKKEIKSTDKFIFGTSALLMDVATTTTELQYLTDDAALTEMTTNAIYANIGATAEQA